MTCHDSHLGLRGLRRYSGVADSAWGGLADVGDMAEFEDDEPGLIAGKTLTPEVRGGVFFGWEMER